MSVYDLLTTHMSSTKVTDGMAMWSEGIFYIVLKHYMITALILFSYIPKSEIGPIVGRLYTGHSRLSALVFSSSWHICGWGLAQTYLALQWRHNDHDGVSNHQPHGCLLNRLFRRRSKKTSKLRVTGICVGNSPGPVNSPHKGPVTRKMFPFDDDIKRKCTQSSSFPCGVTKSC